MTVEFGVLGPLLVKAGVDDVTPRAPKIKTALSLLVLRANRVVRNGELIDELWGENPPPTALTTLQTYVYRLRRLLAEHCPQGDVSMRTEANGYLLTLPVQALDVYDFDALAGQSRTALDAGEVRRAVDLAQSAMALWRGAPLADVRTGNLLAAHVVRLEESRLRMLETSIEAQLRIGRHAVVIGELMELTRSYPVHEGFREQLIMALYRAGRRGEALTEYELLRRVLREELGLDPSVRLRNLHHSLLIDDAALMDEPAVLRWNDDAVTSTVHFGPPAELPADIDDFVGRKDELAEAERWLHRPDPSLTATRILLLTGMPGAGKTALALHLAHRVRGEFPDGQLFVDLRARGGEPVDPHEVLGRFLRSVGVGDDRMPRSTDDRIALFRTWSAQHRALIVLDDAADLAQVTPLLPSGADCTVIVTSSYKLLELPGAYALDVEPLTVDDAADFLIRLLGENQQAARADAEQVARMFGGHPLALRCLGARMGAMRRRRPISALRRMAETHTAGTVRLPELRFGEIDVPQRFDLAYRGLAPLERDIFGLFGTGVADGLTARRVHGVLGQDEPACAVALDRLVRANLLGIVEQATSYEPLYEMHVLLRAFAAGRAG